MKKISKILLAGLMTIGAVGCGNSSTGNTTTGGDDSKVSFTIWHTFTESSEDLLNALVEEYMAEHENVTIEVTGGYDYTTFESTVMSAVTEGVGPNLVFNYASFAKNFDGYDMLLPFEDYWDFKLADVTSAGNVQEASAFADGKVYAAPIQTTGPVLFYNKTLYDECGLEAPVTWDDLKNASKTIYEQTGVVGLAIDSLTDFAQMIILQSHDGEYVDVENKEVLWNDEKTLEWVEWWAEGVKEGYFQLAPTTGDYNSSDMNAGTVAAYIGSSAGIPYLDLSTIGAELAVARIPVIDANSREVVVWNRSAIGFKGADEATNAAIADFVAYFIEQDGRWVECVNAYSPYYAVQHTESYQEYVAQDLALTALGEQMEDGVVTPTFDGSAQIRDALKTLFTGCADPSFDAATALQTAADASNAAMNE